MIAEETIEEIKRRASLAEVVSEQVALKRAGSQQVGLCPFHSERSPSFHVRDDSFYHCFGCGESGNVITYVMRMRGLSFPEAIEELAQRFGITVKRVGGGVKKDAESADRQVLARINRAAGAFFWRALAEAPQVVQTYVRERGISEEAHRAFAIGYAPHMRTALRDYLASKKFGEAVMMTAGLIKRNQRGESYDTFRARLIFPIFADNRRIIGFGGRAIPALLDAETLSKTPKYLNSAETPLYHKSKVLYGLPQALAAMRESEEALIVEGYLDVIGLWQARVRNVVATCGTALTEQHVDRLKRLVRRVVLLFDGDDAGRSAAAKSFNVFLNSGLDVSVSFLPQGEDPDTFARNYGAETSARLKELTRTSLLECYFRGLVSTFGAGNIAELGAALKGKVSSEIAAQLAKVTNAVERAELVQSASLLLRVEPLLLQKLVGGEKALVSSPSQTVKEAREQSGAGSSLNSASAEIRAVGELPRLDQEVLLAAMARKDQVALEILKDPELCAVLSPQCLMFLEGLATIFEAGEQTQTSDKSLEKQKEQIKQLLATFGQSWKNHWKKAYQMALDPSAHIDGILQQCRRSVKKHKLNQAIIEIDRRIEEEAQESMKTQLYQERLDIKRQLQTI